MHQRKIINVVRCTAIFVQTCALQTYTHTHTENSSKEHAHAHCLFGQRLHVSFGCVVYCISVETLFPWFATIVRGQCRSLIRRCSKLRKILLTLWLLIKMRGIDHANHTILLIETSPISLEMFAALIAKTVAKQPYQSVVCMWYMSYYMHTKTDGIASTMFVSSLLDICLIIMFRFCM